MVSIKKTGIDIDFNQVKKLIFLKEVEQKNVKLHPLTNFKSGIVAYEDIVFLPDNTYLEIVIDGKTKIYGKVFHYYYGRGEMSKYLRTAIVPVDYNMNSSKQRKDMKDKLIIDCIDKSCLGNIQVKYKNKYAQVIKYTEDQEDAWEFVKIIYGGCNTKNFYQYAWKNRNGKLYMLKDINSMQIQIPICHYYNILIENYTNDKITGVEYKIKPNVVFVPYEMELIVIYIFFMAITFIFSERFIMWTFITLIFIYFRKKIREEYNG